MKQKTDVDAFLSYVEEVIDIRDDIHEEEQNCNYRYIEAIKRDKYLPAQEAMKEAFKEAVKEVVEDSLRSRNDYIRRMLENVVDEEVRRIMKSRFY